MASVLRSAFAVFAGFVTMAVVVMAATLLSVKLMDLRSGHPTPGYLALNVTYSVLAGALGGWVAGRIGRPRSMLHGCALAALMLVMGALSYWHYRGMQPRWYQVVATLIPAACAIIASRWAGGSPVE